MKRCKNVGQRGNVLSQKTEKRSTNSHQVAPTFLGEFSCYFVDRITVRSSSFCFAMAAVILVEFAVEGLAPNAEGAGGVGFVSAGVIKGGFDCLAFYLIH
jgi:hypothetical protein